MRPTALLVAAVVALLAGCGGSGGEVRADAVAEPSGPSQGTSGTIIVGIDGTVGQYIHGFDAALRFETGAGAVIRATTWVEVVLDEAGEDASLESFYELELEQAMPVGPVVIWAETVLGNEDGSISEVDPEGTLPCRLEVDLARDQLIAVDIDFDRPGTCLREVSRDVPVPPTTAVPTEPPPTTTTEAETAPTTSPPATEPPSSSPPTTIDLPVGSQHHVNIDLVCEAFELGGATWTLVSGDLSSWQPAGERHEGGTFTIETPTTGTFEGDHEGVKSGIFRRLGPDEAPRCEPEVRYPWDAEG